VVDQASGGNAGPSRPFQVFTWIGVIGCLALFAREYHLASYRLSTNALIVLGGALVLFLLPRLSDFEFLGIKGTFQKLKNEVLKEVVNEVKQDQVERDFVKAVPAPRPAAIPAGANAQVIPDQDLTVLARRLPGRFLNFLAFLVISRKTEPTKRIAKEGNLSGMDPTVFENLLDFALNLGLVSKEPGGYRATALAHRLIQLSEHAYEKPARSVFSSEENRRWHDFVDRFD
jgi:hypothetical protein